MTTTVQHYLPQATDDEARRIAAIIGRHTTSANDDPTRFLLDGAPVDQPVRYVMNDVADYLDAEHDGFGGVAAEIRAAFPIAR